MFQGYTIIFHFGICYNVLIPKNLFPFLTLGLIPLPILFSPTCLCPFPFSNHYSILSIYVLVFVWFGLFIYFVLIFFLYSTNGWNYMVCVLLSLISLSVIEGFWGHMFSFVFDIYIRVGKPSHRVAVCLLYRKRQMVFQGSCSTSSSHWQCVRAALHPCQHLVLTIILSLTVLVSEEVFSLRAFHWHLLVD